MTDSVPKIPLQCVLRNWYLRATVAGRSMHNNVVHWCVRVHGVSGLHYNSTRGTNMAVSVSAKWQGREQERRQAGRHCLNSALRQALVVTVVLVCRQVVSYVQRRAFLAVDVDLGVDRERPARPPHWKDSQCRIINKMGVKLLYSGFETCFAPSPFGCWEQRVLHPASSIAGSKTHSKTSFLAPF